MKFSLHVTMDGMLRALRWQAHNMVDAAAADTAFRNGRVGHTTDVTERRKIEEEATIVRRR